MEFKKSEEIKICVRRNGGYVGEIVKPLSSKVFLIVMGMHCEFTQEELDEISAYLKEINRVTQ